MIIGVPKEIKNNENRVGLTPAGVKEIIMRGHQVYVQQSAGLNSGFPDEAYLSAGANLLPTIEEVYAVAEMIVKVKEPIASEYPLIRENQLLFTYFHFASDENLTKAMISLDELKEAAREHGVAHLEDIELAVLEADGNISIISGDYEHRTVKKRKTKYNKNNL